MSLRKSLVELAKSRANGRIVRGTYQPPGSRLRHAADWTAIMGAMGLLIGGAGAATIVSAGSSNYPTVSPGIDPRLNLVILGGTPIVGAVLVFGLVLLGGWRSRLLVAGFGLVGTTFAWSVIRELVLWIATGSVPPPLGLTGLGGGSLLLLVGGGVGAATAYFGEWAKQFDDG